MSAHSPAEVDRLFAQYIHQGELEKLVALYETDGVLVMPDGEHHGHAAIRAAIAPLVEARLPLEMNVLKVVNKGDDVAVLYNDWSAPTPDGPMAGRAIEIVRRQRDGSWLFVIDDPYARG